MRFTFRLLSTILLTGCHSINSVSLTQIPQQRQKKVSAEVSKFIFLGFSFDNDFVDPLVKRMQDQCEGGQIRGILTKDVSINYFLGIFLTREITATGYCLSKGNKKVSLSEIEP